MSFLVSVLSFVIFSRTHRVVMNQTHRVDPKGGEIQAPLDLDQVLDLVVGLDQTHQQRRTVMKQHQTMSPVTQSKAKSHLLSK